MVKTERPVKYVKERRAFGGPLYDKQAVRQRLVAILKQHAQLRQRSGDLMNNPPSATKNVAGKSGDRAL